MKTCRKCDQSKAQDEFYRDSHAADGRRRICKECDKAASSDYKKRNVESCKEYAAAYREQNSEYFKAKQVEFRANNPEYWKNWTAKNIDSERARWRRVYHANIGRARCNELRRRVIKAQAIPKWADMTDIKAVYQEAKYFGMHVDHIVPLRSDKVCGLHVWDNLQLLPAEKNISKGNRFWPDMPA